MGVTEAKYRVGMVSKMTGLSTHTLRMWEKRYAAVLPHRTDAGGRLYTDLDVERLRLLHKLVEEGHSIGGIARLPGEDLSRMAASFPPLTVTPDSAHLLQLRERFIASIERLRVDEAEQMLSRVALSTEPGEFLREVVGPILRDIGDRWERGELRIAHEHASSAVMRGLLFSLMRLYPASDSMRCAVVTTPQGEHHELGALMVGMLAAMHGWRVLYLGANLPADEIAFAVESTNAEVLMLSVSNLTPQASKAELAAIEQAVPVRVRIVAGGQAAVLPEGSRIEIQQSLRTLEELLSR